MRPKDTSTFHTDLARIRDLTVNEPSTVVGRTIFDLLLMELWYISSCDALASFFSDARHYLQDSRKPTSSWTRFGRGKRRLLTQSSILGSFIRRAHLEYQKLQFHESHSLWCAFVRFREPTLSLWRKRKLGAWPTCFDANLKEFGIYDVNQDLVRRVYGSIHASSECEFATVLFV